MDSSTFLTSKETTTSGESECSVYVGPDIEIFVVHGTTSNADTPWTSPVGCWCIADITC